MTILFVILIVILCVILSLIVLVQNPKGGGLAGSIAGFSNQFMGVKQTTDVLENVFDPHNISAVMRSCDAVGVQEIYVLNTRIPFHKKWGFQSSRSAANWLTVHQFARAEECFAALRKKYSKILVTRLSDDAVNLYESDLTQSIALVFGNEQHGVSNETMLMADGSIIIPQVGMISSLNISVACAVILYEAYRQKQKAGHYDQQKLSPQEYSLLSHQWGLEFRV